jgi:uncharacterized membrane protein
LRIYNKYIISLAIASCVINPLLAFFGQNDIIIYLAINIIAYLVITLLCVHFNPKARRALNTVSAVYFAIFFVVVAFKVVTVLLG